MCKPCLRTSVNHLSGLYIFSQTPIEHATGSTRHMVHHDGALWFGLDSDYIVRAVMP